MHDPTTLNRQGADTGPQYRSAIFTHGDEQHATASEVAEKVGKQWYKDAPVTTQIVPIGQWWDAEDYHQLYLGKNPGGYECPAQYVLSLFFWFGGVDLGWFGLRVVANDVLQLCEKVSAAGMTRQGEVVDAGLARATSVDIVRQNVVGFKEYMSV